LQRAADAQRGRRTASSQSFEPVGRVSAIDAMNDERGKKLLDQAFEGLEHETPDRVTKIIRWMRDPKSRWIRLPLGILCIIASFFWFLPVVGVEFLPIGLLLIAEDVPVLRRPVAKLMLWLEARWRALRRRFQQRSRRRAHRW
jgi:hypothetical protein